MNGRGRRLWSIVTLVVATFILAGVPVTIASDAASQCGAAGAKVEAELIKGVVTEATAACVAGSAGHPQPVNAAKLTALTDKVNADAQKAIDKFGDANCAIKPNNAAGDTIDTAQRLANELCLAPTATPTP